MRMAWTIAHARQNFADLVRASEDEPQSIERYGKPVALLIGGGVMEEFLEFQRTRAGDHLAQIFSELRALSSHPCELDFDRDGPRDRNR